MYKRFVKNMSAKKESLWVYHKTIMSDNLNKDLKDNQRGSLIVVSLQVILKTLKALPDGNTGCYQANQKSSCYVWFSRFS